MKITIWATPVNQIPDGTKINRGYLSTSTSFESLLYVKSKFQRGAKGVKIFIANISRLIFVGIFNSRDYRPNYRYIEIRDWLRRRGEASKNEEREQWMRKIEQEQSKVNFPDIFTLKKFQFRIQSEPPRIQELVYPEISWLCMQNFISRIREKYFRLNALIEKCSIKSRYLENNQYRYPNWKKV